MHTMHTSLSPEHFGRQRRPNGPISVFRRNEQREEAYAQPLALKRDDELANGWQLRHDTINTIDGASILFRGNMKRYVPQRLPLQLGHTAIAEGMGVLPYDLRVGDVLQTGDVVLAEPEKIETDLPFSDTKDQYNTRIYLSGGQRPQPVATPSDLHLARFGTLNDLPPDAAFTRIVMDKLKYLRHSLLEKSLNSFAFIDRIQP